MAEPDHVNRGRLCTEQRWVVVGFAELATVEVYSTATDVELNSIRGMALQRMKNNVTSAKYKLPVSCKFVNPRLLEEIVSIPQMSRHWSRCPKTAHAALGSSIIRGDPQQTVRQFAGAEFSTWPMLHCESGIPTSSLEAMAEPKEFSLPVFPHDVKDVWDGDIPDQPLTFHEYSRGQRVARHLDG